MGHRSSAIAQRVTAARSLAARYVRALPIPRARVPASTLPVRWVRIVALTTTMTFVFATAIGTTGFVAQQGTIALAASTTLTIISGDVAVRSSDAAEFAPVGDGALLRAGTTIRTGPETYAVLTYFEGSTVSIGPGTTLGIVALQAHPDGSTEISMRQQIGSTWHAVAKLLHPASKYEIRTPTLTATVRGTAFEVGVEQDPATGEVTSSVITAEGAVGAAKPVTPTEPAPPEVIVPAGFQTTARAAQPVAPPEPAPEPERKVTVTVGAANALVVDPVGRANGEKDGKVVIQTPGARVQRVDGKLVVTLPKVQDGKISTVIAPSTVSTTEQARVTPAQVSVVTVVAERGRGEARTEETVQVPAPTTSGPAVPVITGVEVKRSDAGRPVELRRLDRTEKRTAPAPKLPDPPKLGQRSVGSDKKRDPGDGRGGGGDAGNVGSVIGTIVGSMLPPTSAGDLARRDEQIRKAAEKAKEEAAKRDEERRKEAEKRADELRTAEEKAKDEAAKLGEERRKAEEKAREETAKRGEEARKHAETRAEELRKAEENAKEEAAKLADQRRKVEDGKRKEEMRRAETERKRAEKRADELRKAEEKAKEDAPKELQKLREIEQKAREQARKLEGEKRKEAEKRLDEFRKGEEKAREDAAKRLEERRKTEEKAKEQAEKKIEELRKADETAKEEAAKAKDEKKREEGQKREDEQRSSDNSRRFVPEVKLPPLPGSGGRSGR